MGWGGGGGVGAIEHKMYVLIFSTNFVWNISQDEFSELLP